MNLRRYYFSLLPFLCSSLIWFEAFFFSRFCSPSSFFNFIASFSLCFVRIHTECQWRQQQNNVDGTFFALFHVMLYRCTDYESNTHFSVLAPFSSRLAVCIVILSHFIFDCSALAHFLFCLKCYPYFILYLCLSPCLCASLSVTLVLQVSVLFFAFIFFCSCFCHIFHYQCNTGHF